MAKELNEISKAGGQIIDAFVKTFKDRKFDSMEFQNFINPLLSAIAAGNDAGLSIPEMQTMPNSEKAQTVQIFQNELASLDNEDKDDVTGIYSGVISLTRLLVRNAYERGLEDGKKIATSTI